MWFLTPVAPMNVPSPVVERKLAVAVSLMRMALVLLDRSGDASFGAARLQHAIDTVTGGSDRSD